MKGKKAKARAATKHVIARAGSPMGFILMMSLAPCEKLYCVKHNPCWPCRARKFVEGVR
jgi:hypothetical protein